MHSPQTNGFCERFHGTLREEFVRVALRKKVYGRCRSYRESRYVAALFCSEERSHRLPHAGQTPWQAFQDGVAAMSSAPGGVTRR